MIKISSYLVSLESDIVELILLNNKTDEEVYNLYKYKTWNNLHSIIRRYLFARFNISKFYPVSVVTPELSKKRYVTSYDDAIGKVFDEYKILNEGKEE